MLSISKAAVRLKRAQIESSTGSGAAQRPEGFSVTRRDEGVGDMREDRIDPACVNHEQEWNEGRLMLTWLLYLCPVRHHHGGGHCGLKEDGN